MRNLLLAGVAAMAFSTGAQAALTPLTSATAFGPMTVVFVFKQAADTSTLSWDQGAGAAVLVNNSTAAIGATVSNFGAAGPVTFTLENVTKGYTFTLGTAVDGQQHFQGSANFADFGVNGGVLSAAAAAAVAAAGPGGIFVGVEDRKAPDTVDFDFNDLIYYFRSIRTDVEVPAPAALGLFGLGLLGLAALRRRG